MVRFTPKTLKENVNISTASPIREAVILSISLILIVLFCYLCAGIILDILIVKIPFKLDRLAEKVVPLKAFETPEKFIGAKREIQKIIDDMIGQLPNSSMSYTVDIVDNDQVNAFAFPGGHIVIFSGLLGEIESENELVMVLGHELGHFVHHDHLRALGRGLVLVFFSSALFGVDSGATSFFSGIITAIDLKFSRGQELAADHFALGLVDQKYGHSSGATDFFLRLSQKEKDQRFLRFFLTHPLSSERIELLNHSIMGLSNYSANH